MSSQSGVHIVLVTPQIPQNTGNIARLSVATGSHLHLVGELGFSLDDRYLKRAGLDYWPEVRLHRHDTLEACLEPAVPEAIALYSARSSRPYTEFRPAPDLEPWLVFGREADGLPPALLATHAGRAFRIPTTDGLRSLNLANAVAVATFEVLRQRGFPQASG